jgi:hypothetical protein
VAPAWDAGDPGRGVDHERLHPDRSMTIGAVDHAVVGDAVAAAADRQREAELASEVDRRRDVGGAGGPDDGERVAVGNDGLGPTGRVEGVAAGREELAGEPGAEVVELGRDGGDRWVVVDGEAARTMVNLLASSRRARSAAALRGTGLPEVRPQGHRCVDVMTLGFARSRIIRRCAYPDLVDSAGRPRRCSALTA